MRFSHALILLAALLILIIVVIPVSGVLLGFIHLDDDFYGANSEPIERSWAATSAPKVVVENSDGAITIKPSTDGRITASLVKNTLCKNNSQEIAEDSLRFVHVEMVQDGDTIRVVARPTADMPKNEYDKTGTYITVSASIEITVPAGAQLDLSTGTGSIWVVGQPDEIHAKNQGGIILFELDSSREAQKPGTVPGRIKLQGFDGSAESRFDGKTYTYSGVVKPVP